MSIVLWNKNVVKHIAGCMLFICNEMCGIDCLIVDRFTQQNILRVYWKLLALLRQIIFVNRVDASAPEIRELFHGYTYCDETYY